MLQPIIRLAACYSCVTSPVKCHATCYSYNLWPIIHQPIIRLVACCSYILWPIVRSAACYSYISGQSYTPPLAIFYILWLINCLAACSPSLSGQSPLAVPSFLRPIIGYVSGLSRVYTFTTFSFDFPVQSVPREFRRHVPTGIPKMSSRGNSEDFLPRESPRRYPAGISDIFSRGKLSYCNERNGSTAVLLLPTFARQRDAVRS